MKKKKACSARSRTAKGYIRAERHASLAGIAAILEKSQQRNLLSKKPRRESENRKLWRENEKGPLKRKSDEKIS